MRSLIALVALVALTSMAPSVAGDTSVKTMLAVSAAYLAEYQAALSFLLADEQTTQTVLDATGRETARRMTTGEFFVTFVRETGAWMSVRDVAFVDGRPLDDRQDLRRALQDEPLPGLARRLMERNARFNIGRVIRNFNEPTLALRVLEPARRSQFKFERRRVERAAEAELVTLSFKESGGPTLVRSLSGGNVRSTGAVTIEAATGRIRRTYIRFTDGPVAAQLTTVYEREPKLAIWVPISFAERYERTKGDHELIICETQYTNYRKFEVEVRIR